MPVYRVTIATGSQWFAGTDDYIYITLVGSEHCSERKLLDKPLYNDFERGAVSEVEQLPLYSLIYILYIEIVSIVYSEGGISAAYFLDFPSSSA